MKKEDRKKIPNWAGPYRGVVCDDLRIGAISLSLCRLSPRPHRTAQPHTRMLAVAVAGRAVVLSRTAAPVTV
jgi:hypothetical protein